MTEIPDEIMAKAREVVANIPGKITAPQFASMVIARAILSERTASEDRLTSIERAAIAAVKAQEAFDKFERENPNDSTKKWDEVFHVRNNTFETLQIILRERGLLDD